MKEICPLQLWAITGGGLVTGLRDGFFISQIDGWLDAPVATPAGSTVENVLDLPEFPELHGTLSVAGAIVWSR